MKLINRPITVISTQMRGTLGGFEIDYKFSDVNQNLVSYYRIQLGTILYKTREPNE